MYSEWKNTAETKWGLLNNKYNKQYKLTVLTVNTYLSDHYPDGVNAYKATAYNLLVNQFGFVNYKFDGGTFEAFLVLDHIYNYKAKGAIDSLISDFMHIVLTHEFGHCLAYESLTPSEVGQMLQHEELVTSPINYWMKPLEKLANEKVSLDPWLIYRAISALKPFTTKYVEHFVTI